MSELISVEVAYATASQQHIVALSLPAGSTVAAAIAASGLAERFPELATTAPKIGIHGHVCLASTVLRANDRVELYRPLIADPKDARHRRVALGKHEKHRRKFQ